MFTMQLESNVSGYGASYPSASCCRGGADSEFVHQHAQPTLSFSQMLRLSMEERSREGGSDDASRWRGNGAMTASKEAYRGSCERSKEEASYRAASVCVIRQAEEGVAESDYGFTLCRASDGGRTSTCGGFTRTCKLCGTSKTPLWRSGPMGAKSLCNACGIRSNKAKKLWAASNQQEVHAPPSKQLAAPSKLVKRKKAELEARQKRLKWDDETHGELIAKEGQKQRISVDLLQQQGSKLPRLQVNVVASSPVKTESSSCVTSRGTPSPCSTHRRPCTPPMSMVQVSQAYHESMCVFPKDEEQAAFLLMALSCGIVLA